MLMDTFPMRPMPCPDCGDSRDACDCAAPTLWAHGDGCARCDTDLTADVLRWLDAGGPAACAHCGLHWAAPSAAWLDAHGYDGACNPSGRCSCCLYGRCATAAWYCDQCAADLPAALAPAYRGQLGRRDPALRNAVQYGRFGPI